MSNENSGRWHRAGLPAALSDIIRESERPWAELTVADLAPLDQFHFDGREATLRLARLLQPAPGTTVLDVGGGLGGPARTLAAEFGCVVTVLDLTEDYLRAGEMLTAGLRLQDSVRFDFGDALDLPYPPETFDVVWTQNSGMNIEDKARLYAGMHRVLKPGGHLATQEPTASPGGTPIHFPLMWAETAEDSFLLTSTALVATISAAGFTAIVEDEYRPAAKAPADFTTANGAYTIQGLVKGERLREIAAAANLNREAGRMPTSFMGLFRRA